MTDLHPAIEPYDFGMLDVGDDNLVYWETCGRADGRPAVVLHGGPGSGCTAEMRRLFDPAVFRIVLFDQRGSGRSTPHASDIRTTLHANATPHLLRDIEALRRHLGIERWMVFGSSWGATLALAYAQTYAERVSGLVLAHVTTSRRGEINWLYHGLGQFFPAAWERFRDGAGAAAADANLVEAYARRLHDIDPVVRDRAAADWCAWEAAIVSIDPRHPRHPRYDDRKFRMAFARIVTHYFQHYAWLEDGVLLRNAPGLAGIPGVMVHGRLDLQAPLGTAWALARVWPDSELVVVENAGHDSTTSGMRAGILAAIDRFARGPAAD